MPQKRIEVRITEAVRDAFSDKKLGGPLGNITISDNVNAPKLYAVSHNASADTLEDSIRQLISEQPAVASWFREQERRGGRVSRVLRMQSSKSA